MSITPPATRQADALRVIRKHWRAFGQSPTRAEIGAELGITKVSAHLLVRKLERDGFVTVRPGCWRNIELRPQTGARS